MTTLTKKYLKDVAKLKQDWTSQLGVDEYEFLLAYQDFVGFITPDTSAPHDAQFNSFGIEELRKSYQKILDSNPSERILYRASGLYTKSLECNASRAEAVKNEADVYALITAVLVANLYVTKKETLQRGESLLKDMLGVSVTLDRKEFGNATVLPLLEKFFSTAWTGIMGMSMDNGPNALAEVWRSRPVFEAVSARLSALVKPATCHRSLDAHDQVVPDTLTP